MESPVPPYPPSPRHVPPELGRRPMGSRASRLSSLALSATGVFLFAVCPMLFAAAGLLCLVAEDLHIVLRASGFLIAANISLISLKSLLPRRLPLPAGATKLPLEQEPIALAFVDQVARDLGCFAPKAIVLSSGVELVLSGKRSLFDLVRPGRSELIVGLWLWNTLTLSEFQAAIARTIAPFSRGKFAGRRYLLRELLRLLLDGHDFVDEMAEREERISWFARLLRNLHLIVTYPQRVCGRILHQLAKREEEALADDLAAVRITGSDSLVHAVLRADFAGATLHQADAIFKREADCGIFTPDLYVHSLDAANALWVAHKDFTIGQTPTLRSPSAGKYADVFAPGQGCRSAMWAGLPSAPEREQSAKRIFVAAERDDRPASILLTASPRWRGILTRSRYLGVLKTTEDYIAMPCEVVSRWIAEDGKLEMSDRHDGSYDEGRAIEPGTPQERNSAISAGEWVDAQLLHSADKLYIHAGERAARLKSVQTALKKVMRRTLFRPTGRDRALADDLEDDIRKLGRWLAALDRWTYTIHMQMAARLPDLEMHEALLARYETVLRFQSVPTDVRGYRDRVAIFVRRLGEHEGDAPDRLVREAQKEFKASRKNLELLLQEVAEIEDPFLSELVSGVPLDQFLYSHGELPSRKRSASRHGSHRLMQAWDELLAKACWLREHGVLELLRIHEEIRTRFTEQVGELPDNYEPIVLEAMIPNDDETPLELEPEIVEIETVDDIGGSVP